MIGPTIDVTKRARIRALAARMHRAGIAGVLSIDGGAVGVAETMLTDHQRIAATAILDEVTSASVDVDDVVAASRVASMVPHYVKPSCSTCHGAGLMRHSGIDDLCACVDRRWQAAVNHQAFVDGLHAPGRAFGARVESTRAADNEKRVASAKDVLARARDAVTAACADLDASIAALEAAGAPYHAERARLDADARPAAGHASAVAGARAEVESIVLRIGQILEPLFEIRSVGPSDADRAQAHAAVDAAYAAAAEVSRHCFNLGAAETAARRLATLDADNAPLVGEIARLRAERARVARRPLLKVDRAEKRLRRLIYLFGDTSGNVGTVPDAQVGSQEESEGR